MMVIEGGMGLYVIYVGLRARRPLIVALMLAQAGLMLWLELAHGSSLEAAQTFFVDKFSVIMALINGVVGGGICLYALGYMREYHEVAHREVADRRPLFFALLFIFMGAMFGIIFANNLMWLFLFWEITTLCSFLLIGYTGTEEAQQNALRALVMNLAGGLAFALAIVWFHHQSGSIELQKLITSKQSLALLPAALLCFAGITKSAQLPFSSWLLGAMVAPTPVSALLHSSTMVKAGVYLVLRMAPGHYGHDGGFDGGDGGCGDVPGRLIGGHHHQRRQEGARVVHDRQSRLDRDVRRHRNLPGGLGGRIADYLPRAGQVPAVPLRRRGGAAAAQPRHRGHERPGPEHAEGGRNDADRDGGHVPGPVRHVDQQMGGAQSGGGCLSRAVSLHRVRQRRHAVLLGQVDGQIAGGREAPVSAEAPLALGQAIALYGLAAATFLACLFFPLISSRLIEPYVFAVYGQSASMAPGNIIIMTIMMVMIMLFPLSYINYGRGVRVTDAYLGGANVPSSARFLGSGNAEHEVTTNNYYLHGVVSEPWLTRYGVLCSTASCWP